MGTSEFEKLKRIKEIRQKRGISLRQLAQKTGLSAYYLSQVERGKANPSMATMKRITDALAMPLKALLTDTEDEEREAAERSERIKVVRADRRKALIYPGSTRSAALLTADLQGKLEVLLTVEDPEPEMPAEWYSHDGEEFVFVLEGQYEIIFKDVTYRLEEGDSISYPSRFHHKTRNPGGKTSKILWVVTPPSF